jgi:hypothetical protein
MQSRPDNIGSTLAKVVEQGGVRIPELNPDSLFGEAVGNSAARAEGDVTLMRNTPGKNDDVRG